ncbi:7-deoxyloganetin glucosyltransferase [Quercus suber]|uniref:7-deoxyloganetin glucosyltransferase n=1 Tax=Quercus suber TaxID=58331 RepID=A0AAW0LI68_QUESU
MADGLPDFHFEIIPDGLPPSDADVSQDVASLCDSTSKNCLVPYCNFLYKLNDTLSSNVPPVTCIVADGVTSFTFDPADKFGIPCVVLFWTPSACGFLNYMHFRHLVQLGMKNIRLMDIPSFVRTTDENDIMFNFFIRETERVLRALAVILNTFNLFEKYVLDALSNMLPCLYTIGVSFLDQIKDNNLESIGSNLWKEEPRCVEWLNSKEPNSVVYVNYGSITIMTPEQLIEFAWGLADSEKHFLWIIRPDLVKGDLAIIPPEFVTETKDRGMLASWCLQEKILKHPSIGGS